MVALMQRTGNWIYLRRFGHTSTHTLRTSRAHPPHIPRTSTKKVRRNPKNRIFMKKKRSIFKNSAPKIYQKSRTSFFGRLRGYITIYPQTPKKDVQTRSSHTNVNFPMDVQRMCEDVRTSFAHPFF